MSPTAETRSHHDDGFEVGSRVMDPNLKMARLTSASALIAVALLGAGLAASPQLDLLPSGLSMLAVHLLMELFAIIIAILVVAISWYTFDAEGNRAANILICGFAVVASCDIAHALTYEGMPPFLGPGNTHRAIFFWFMGRTFEVTALALLAFDFAPRASRRFSLGAGLLCAATVIWFGSYRIDEFPVTFIKGVGVTAFKARYEFFLCSVYLVVSGLLWKRAKAAGELRWYLLALSAFVTGIGEVMFTTYARPSDFQNIFGHFFKLVAYALLYRATFVSAILEPIVAARNSERSLRQSEEKLRGLYELSPLGIALTDMQGHYIEFNEAFRAICGYPAEELRRLDYWALTPGEYATEEARQLESLERTGHYGPYEKEYIRKDGSRVPLRLNGMLITGAGGQRMIWSIVEDIADRKRAERAMVRERTRLETILRTASDGIHILDANGVLIEANEAFLASLGYERSVIGRLRVEQWDAQMTGEGLRTLIKTLVDSKESMLFETRHRRRDGSIIDVEINTCGIELGDQKFIYASSRDVTVRKRAAALMQLLESLARASNEATTPTVAMQSCLERICTYGNWSIGHVVMFMPEKTPGSAPVSLWHSENAARFRDFIEYSQSYSAYDVPQGQFASRAIRERRPIWCENFSELANPADSRTGLLAGFGIRSGFVLPVFVGDVICGLLEFFASEVRAPDTMLLDAIDSVASQLARLIERSRAAAQLEQLNAELEMRVRQRTAELEAANTELDSFSYTIAHDLRAPLRSINGFGEIMLKETEGRVEEATAGYLKRIIASSRYMSELIDNLLNLARFSRQEMRRSDIDLSEMAGTVIASLRASGPQREVTVTVGRAIHVNGDPGLMRALMENLIGNAWKYTAKVSDAKIEIGIVQIGAEAVCFVRDNGAGFDMQYAQKLFIPFQRLHHAGEFEGTGIGLAIVKRIVQRHGGRVWIESAVNVGTSVYFTVGNSP